MNKTELVAAIATHTKVDRKQVAVVLDGLEDVVATNVKKGEKVALTGFVSFERVDRKARTARNPQTGEAIKVKASKAPRVSAGATFKKVVNGQVPAPKLVTR
ncbi:MAG: HU family DNA-binding protein [Acidimicrobiales bacterium]